jgi:hypothetical protein
MIIIRGGSPGMGKDKKQKDGKDGKCKKDGPCGKVNKEGCCKRCGKQRK